MIAALEERLCVREALHRLGLARAGRRLRVGGRRLGRRRVLRRRQARLEGQQTPEKR